MAIAVQSNSVIVQFLSDIPIVTRCILFILLLWCISRYTQLTLLSIVVSWWDSRSHSYEFWRMFGLFMVVHYNSLQTVLMLFYQVYTNSCNLELDYFVGDSVNYSFFLLFCMTTTTILASLSVALFEFRIATLFPAFEAILLYTWSVTNTNTSVNYIIFSVQGKYLPLINLLIHILDHSPHELSMMLFGYTSAYIYCCLDTWTFGPLFGFMTNKPNYGYPTFKDNHFKGRHLLMRLFGSGAKAHPPVAQPHRGAAKSTTSATNFKGQGRRLHDGKAIPLARRSFLTPSTAPRCVELIRSASQFSSSISPNRLVIVDFFATWCGPCKMLAPILEQYASQHPNVDFYKLDVDHLSTIASTYSVTSMPTVIVFKKGTELARIVGVNPTAIKKAIQSNS
ncbi:Dfm1p Ecym_5464 [Eremothecium cymbalariae DBVPG|uniref:Derlin n=1 Tax=Eremothecium cymbalariae (strain CBS 270.75 / DBVPG 7215 / KCTC 17166 / NRRL Y-17582) TaxID=931890 RepID=I6NDS1_ERECY|nr:hypothetical protein Ecym_5464 [Eremothecium cymbalariae DBVPG\